MNRLHQLRAYLTYWLDQVDERSLHSPFFFDLYQDVIKKQQPLPDYEIIESLRKRLLESDEEIDVLDLGAGSVLPSGKRRVGKIAATSLSKRKYSQLYAALIRRFGSRQIIELGTSFGINSLYLSATAGTTVTTFEGSPAIASYARTTLEFAARSNVHIIEGDIATTLPRFLISAPKVDFAFIDANHRYEPTCRYFQMLLTRTHTQSLVLIDDIHYSAEMERAWTELKKSPTVYGSIDLYKVGILFFDPSLNKQDVVLQF
jgi:predicted O-methyltransferase YrrM